MTKEDRKTRYVNAKEALLNDPQVCNENRQLWAEFLKWEENKLKRSNGLNDLDDGAYKTLYYYLIRFRNINTWFKNKPWKALTKEDIQRVYDGLEDGTILSQRGTPFESLGDYYSKIFKSKPFEMAGKLELANEVIEYSHKEEKEVRFILEPEFRKLVGAVSKQNHKLLFWLAWDIGENINALLQLKKSDCYKEKNPVTEEPEYRINLRSEILKRSRKARAEITNYHETVELLDEYLHDLAPHDLLFQYDYANAKKIMNRAVENSKVTVLPSGGRVTWKDLRSGMVCDLLKKGWNRDELNARLGHKPSSEEIDKYMNFLAINRHEQKQKIETFKVKQLSQELEAAREREKLQAKRLEELQEEVKRIALLVFEERWKE